MLPLGRCINAIAQLGSAANLVSSLGYMAAADGGAGQAAHTYSAGEKSVKSPSAVAGAAGMAAAVERA